ncbi:hypothetical protein [Streptomyces sp. NPDC097619]|uniref:hypothetical protein n=1 Tax=Streptomyces sp. NPDC097619 TaxID=3157228 RepID=UPI00333379E4
MTALPYLEVTDAAYAPAYVTGLRRDDTADGAVLTGTCPRCGCAFAFTYTRRVFRHPRPRSGRVDGATVPVLCVCGSPHEGRPEGEEGCGAYWNVVLERARR